jgi:hypothetical protein
VGLVGGDRQQRRLPDAGLAFEEHRTTATCREVGDPATGDPEVVLAADQRDRGVCLGHDRYLICMLKNATFVPAGR